MGKDLHDGVPRGARGLRRGGRRARRAALRALLRGAGGRAQAHRQHPAGDPHGLRGRRARCSPSAGIAPDLVAGHSLGEYSALVAAGALRRRRGREGRPRARHVHAGGGAGGAGRDERGARARSRRRSGRSAPRSPRRPARSSRPRTTTSPAQTVIAGAAGAVERAGREAQGGGREARAAAPGVRPLPLRAHGAGEGAARARAPRRSPGRRRACRWSRTSRRSRTRTPRAIVPLLVEQVTAPVRWIECVEELVRQGVTRVVEVGPGKVLSGLAKRIDKSRRGVERRGPAPRSRRRSPRSRRERRRRCSTSTGRPRS